MTRIKPPGENPLDRLAAGPDRTRVENAELSSVDPDAHDAFQKQIRRRWYMQIALGTLVAFSVEYALWGLFGWWALLPLFFIIPYIHRLKWDRHTDYGALAAAKLAENPHSEWNRERLKKRHERECNFDS